MKVVLISIQPKWCELIASGEKTIEVRKTKPKLKTPFKVYIYCTKARESFIHGGIRETLDDLYRLPSGEIKYGYSGELMCYGEGEYDENNFLNGKVIGEFVCDKVFDICIEISKPDDLPGYPFPCTGLTDKEILQYLGNGKTGYGWHISDLVIYDEPKELSEFKEKRTITTYTTERNIEGIVHYLKKEVVFDDIITPPQSWRYCHFEEWGW